MTVQELIDELLKIQNKTLAIKVISEVHDLGYSYDYACNVSKEYDELFKEEYVVIS